MKNLTGQSFGRLIVIKDSGKRTKVRSVYWECKCICGNLTLVTGSELLRGGSRSCGCLKSDVAKETVTKRNFKHGHTVNNKMEYRTWRNMLSRCYKKYCANYDSYGGRGVYVCDRWHSFENFLEDMGKRPPNSELDRTNPYNLEYSKENCQWISRWSGKRRSNYEGDVKLRRPRAKFS